MYSHWLILIEILIFQKENRYLLAESNLVNLE